MVRYLFLRGLQGFPYQDFMNMEKELKPSYFQRALHPKDQLFFVNRCAETGVDMTAHGFLQFRMKRATRKTYDAK
jgi:hypothetical protein